MTIDSSRVPPIRVEQQKVKVEMPSVPTQDILEMVFDPQKAINSTDVRALKVAFKILRAAFAEASDEVGKRCGRSQQEMETFYVVAGCQRIQGEKSVIIQTQTLISNPLEKRS